MYSDIEQKSMVNGKISVLCLQNCLTIPKGLKCRAVSNLLEFIATPFFNKTASLPPISS